ncbi:Gfo/Idh/MocA family protein [Nakamurella endophytica]|uniref:Oxidoreductase n=1 Tax=Nakamurella endophytica TaxID=1748367 RepID=A0A917TD87_9ACTN|nr:Gfo/Idh/MocA family oxidoreductase [Nakamurella endophytica]GGM18971.1 oxidoreductase [Nakamurella endophytica]
MSTARILKVGIVGLEFGAEFIPIYQRHPNAEMYAICQRTETRLHEVGDRYGVPVRYTDYADMLADPQIDVIHINTPLQLHADQVVAALEAGKHVGCTIPMATSVQDCRRIVDAQRRTGLTYMMMETTLYSREFLYLRDLYTQGHLGRLQFLRSSHHQDMSGWPSYWDGMPPMYNATHAIGPTVGLAGHEAESVQCLGSGTVFDRMKDRYGSPFALESTHISLLGSDVGVEVTRHLWAVARQYRESFDVYGSIRSFEWAQTEDLEHVLYLGETPERITVPDFADRLPEDIRSFTTQGVYTQEGDSEHRSFVQGGGHGGSHPHLAHRLLQAVLGEAEAFPDAVQAANITCAGILSHESALAGGKRIELPEWTLTGRPPFVVPLAQQPEPAWAGAPSLDGGNR